MWRVLCPHELRYPQRPKEGMTCPRAGITNSGEPPAGGAGTEPGSLGKVAYTLNH